MTSTAFQQKEAELNAALAKMERASASVKKVTADVKKGVAIKSDLEQAILKLKEIGSKVKLLSVESKVLNGWEPHRLGDDDSTLPTGAINPLWVIVGVVALLYLLQA